MEEKDVKIQDLKEGVLRRKWTIVLTTLVVITVMMAYTFMQPPQYIAATVMMLETANVGLTAPQPVSPRYHQTTKPVEFYQAILSSASLRQTLFQMAASDTTVMAIAREKDLNLPVLLASNISLNRSELPGFVELQAVTPDPELSYRLATLATQHLKSQSLRIDEEQARNEIDYLDAQRETTKEKLEHAEAALQEFREKTSVNITDANDGGLIKQLTEMENELTAIQTQRELAESNLASYRRRFQEQFSENFVDYDDSPRIAKLKSKLADLQSRYHAALEANADEAMFETLKAQIDFKKQEIVNEILSARVLSRNPTASSSTLLTDLETSIAQEEIDLYALRNREAYQRRLIDEFRKKHPSLLENAIEMSRLTREKTVLENLYTFLVERSEEAKIRAATGTGGIRIIDPATQPKNPKSLNVVKRLILAMMCGSLLGLVAAYLRESLDQSIKSADEVTQRLGLSLLGYLPETDLAKAAANASSSEGAKNADLVYSAKANSPLTEAFRTIRANLQYALADGPLQVIAVTSPSPKEGKSFMVANLAAAVAESEKRVLIIDADLRRPRQHNIFAVERQPGLTNLVVKGMSLHEAAKPSGVYRVNILTCGAIPPNPAEILSSRNFALILTLARKEYDMIILDTPPITAVADPLVVSKLADGIIVVLRHEVTNRNVARECVARFQRVNAKIAGVVLNGAMMRPGSSYYRYYNYYDYYSSREEPKAVNKERNSKQDVDLKFENRKSEIANRK